MNTDGYGLARTVAALPSAFIGVLALMCLTSIAGCGSVETAPPLWQFAGPTMGTSYSVSLIGGTEDRAMGQQEQVVERLAEVNRRMSTYDPSSELSRFNASDSTDWFDVSRETASVVASALALAEDSSGAYDPTVGPLVNLWGFGPGERRTSPPADAEIAAALANTGHASIEVRLEPPSLKKSNPSLYVDLSSIAKGHGVDAIAGLLTDAGYEAFMVEIGGEVRTRGTKPGGKSWRIGVERVDTDGPLGAGDRRLQRVVELVDRSMATSGDYRNFFEHDGHRYSHTIDPTTGKPVTHNLATATVLAATCREADGLATALLVLGPAAGYDWAIERGIAALMVSRGEDDQLVVQTTPAWDSATAEAER